ncbi:site-2 protease family protein [Cohnella sp. CFH 77786]|uniref:site-2 protease family protein n=1 Tax=Cohnella sp. CFH 77786 TaxID=2662265 RepID=UPI001C60A02F|nr:site-2 protease family protein [Cohnella sp. CFH 77786]MBW5444912.1 site-2 protease family protein [Cohnella sp. CFH 77786]
MSFFWFPIEHLPIIILVMLVAFSTHEFGHAWTAYKLGDDTAYREGRVTLNPKAHLDWMGFLLLIVAGFGWAKPVPVRESKLRRPYRLSSILVTAAGPVSNLVLAFLGLLVYAILFANMNISEDMTGKLDIFFYYWVVINLNLFIFNLIPLPPLDGYRILEQFFPLRVRIRMMQYEQWTFFLFLLLIFIPPLRDVTIGPLFALKEPILRGMHHVLEWFFSQPASPIFEYVRDLGI